MKNTEKLRVLIPHWIEHNQEHAQEFLDWVKKLDDDAILEDLQAAADAMASVNPHLEKALEKLGGALDYDHKHAHGHDHNHTHHHHT